MFVFFRAYIKRTTSKIVCVGVQFLLLNRTPSAFSIKRKVYKYKYNKLQSISRSGVDFEHILN